MQKRKTLTRTPQILYLRSAQHGENARQNAERFAPLHDLAEELGSTSAQLALAWVLHQGQDIVPIPGTRRPEHIAENLASANVQLTAQQLAQMKRSPRAALRWVER